MAHFVKIENGIVVHGVVVNNVELLDENGVESEAKGIAFCSNLLGGTWKQTSYNTQSGQHTLGGTPFRKNFAGVGFTYDKNKDAFIAPQPFPSWTLNEETCLWEAPIEMPTEGGPYIWDETIQNWKNLGE